MDIKLKKYELMEWLMLVNDEATLYQLEAFKKSSEKDFWEELPEPVKLSIEKAKLELDKGEGISHEKVISEIKKRFLNT